MRIDITGTLTVADLRARLDGADEATVLEFFKVPKKQQTGECWCGCGATTKNRFAPGHDSKFHSLAKQVARGQAEMPEFIHEDAREDFMKWYDAEVPVWRAKQAEKEAKAAVRAEEKRVRAEAKLVAAVAEVESDMTLEEIKAAKLTPDREVLLAKVMMKS